MEDRRDKGWKEKNGKMRMFGGSICPSGLLIIRGSSFAH